MTRKEQVKEYLPTIGNGEMTGIPFDAGFECGVEWADTHPHWISVEDELPKDYEPVLAAFANHFARVCFHCGKTWYLNKPLAAEEMGGITHWMPLPAPPIGNSEKPNNCKKFDMKGYENVVIHEGNAKGGILKTIDADKVIEWLNEQACLGWIEDVEVDKFVEKFKKDFAL